MSPNVTPWTVVRRHAPAARREMPSSSHTTLGAQDYEMTATIRNAVVGDEELLAKLNAFGQDGSPREATV